MSWIKALLTLVLTGLVSTSWADTIRVAVASNFARPMQNIITAFEQDSGHKVLLSTGASGHFVAQITHGAPFELFLSADQDKVQKLLRSELAVKDSDFTYALGRLVLWSPKTKRVTGEEALQNDFQHLAIADAKLAPYGLATQQVLTKLALFEPLKPRFVIGKNIAQTHQFVASGNAELGFVAYSQVLEQHKIKGSGWLVPKTLHTAIRQDAVLLKSGEHSQAARDLLTYLQSDAAQTIITQFGYDLPTDLPTPPLSPETQSSTNTTD